MSTHTVSTVRRPKNIDHPGATEWITVRADTLHNGSVRFSADRYENREYLTYFGTTPGKVLNALAQPCPHVEQMAMSHEGDHVERHLWVG